ncbi:hypothetical protein EDD76_11225 [Kineothrix alysoides]|uniref:Butirosin biosynthesis protein H-like n=1 Tax=Kineothrix alysoides TaxID=1469948 RepID=A0A4R1QQY8_9FIRM|nr:hypothetical protein [Kineothrix alysoides]TCL56198.1 hypothetical protein EDD76_11225 [Kineothrix alysoides]
MERSKKKILPIATSPVIGFLHHAYDLEILLTNKTFFSVFYMNYIHLNFLKDNFFDRYAHYLDFCGVDIDGYIETHDFEQNDLCVSGSNICERIIGHIDNDWYVEVVVDEFSIPDRVFYKNHHFFHAMQIFGYGENEFYASGFRANNIYGNHTVLFEDFMNAIINETGYKIKKIKDIAVELNPIVIRTKLQEYLDADDLSIKYPEYAIRNGGAGKGLKFYWGMDIYKGFFLYLDLLNKDKAYFDIRLWHILWEHKSCMLKRVIYLTEKGYAELKYQQSTYNEIERLAYIIRGKMLKFKFSKNKKLLTDVNDILQRVRDMEMKEIKVTVSLLSNYNF